MYTGLCQPCCDFYVGVAESIHFDIYTNVCLKLAKRDTHSRFNSLKATIYLLIGASADPSWHLKVLSLFRTRTIFELRGGVLDPTAGTTLLCCFIAWKGLPVLWPPYKSQPDGSACKPHCGASFFWLIERLHWTGARFAMLFVCLRSRIRASESLQAKLRDLTLLSYVLQR